MITFEPCRCGEPNAIARLVKDEAVTLSPEGQILDRSGSDAIEDIECARCSRTLRVSEDLSPRETDLLLDGQA